MLLSACCGLPKVELHAHLHGSIRTSTLVELLVAKGYERRSAEIMVGIDYWKDSGDRLLSDCFRLFDVMHTVVDSLEVVRRITAEVIEDFALDNVVYLELRTTPRPFTRADGTQTTTRRDYCAVVLDVLEQARRLFPHLIVRVLLSVDRSGTLEEANECIDVAVELQATGWVVGVDFGGNPEKSIATDGSAFAHCFKHFLPCFHRARAHGLKITVHIAEVVNAEDTDTILAFAPERLGHGVKMDQMQIRQLLLSSNVAQAAEQVKQGAKARAKTLVEICPTSNIHTLSLTSLAQEPRTRGYLVSDSDDSAIHKILERRALALRQHPTLGLWLNEGHPIALCTDDSCIFNTTLSYELCAVALAFHLEPEDLLQLTETAITHSFAQPQVQAELRGKLAAYRAQRTMNAQQNSETEQEQNKANPRNRL